ncbi:MAG TPA: carboxypeptidase regulatory-like domain-containing protein [Pyrinomonadaceae bacterium]|nr:carboxypeptidase regulatory-like domain-containing protein [Pyrinomonadaceae bacterium]
MTRIFLYLLAFCLILTCLSTTFATAKTLNLRDFGATGDGATDDAPAFQKALDALAAAGGGTLFIPEGKYVIATPVSKNFNGLASSITITGVESLTMPAPPTARGDQLCLGLDLPTEVYPRTGEANVAISISGLKNLVVKDIAFVGTPAARTDAAITLLLTDIDKAQVRHNEFYGLLTLVPGGGIVKAVRSDLEISLSKFLGSTATSGWYIPLVENLEWRGITVTDTTFLDYGCRPDFFSKTGIAAPISWINIGNAAQPTNLSPRREVVLRNVFLDEGGFWGVSSLPYRYLPESAPIDLIYVTGLYMNVSNFGQFGNHIYDARRVFIEKSHYGWSHNATAAIGLRNVGTAILDQLTCVAAADHLFADENTGEMIVINSTYAQLDSFAKKTVTIDTPADEDDPVQYVRARFADALGRDSDAAAHFYWSNLLIHCFNDSACSDAAKQALDDYLSTLPSPTFTISGGITDNNGAALAGATVTLSGSQSVTTTTDDSGNYFFTNLPTSGDYVITAAKNEYTFNSATATFITPRGDQTADFTAQLTASLKKFAISGRVVSSNGEPMAGVLLTLAGSVNRTATTTVDGAYSFTDLAAGSSCTVTAAKDGYVMSPLVQTFDNLDADAITEFEATKLPVLLTVPYSNRAVALELTQFLSGPFPITSTLLSDGRNRTRIIVFGTDVGLLPGEDVEAIMAEAEDAAGGRYPLRVEFVSALAELPQVSQLVLRLTRDLEDSGEVLVTITVHGRMSNKVRIAIQP